MRRSSLMPALAHTIQSPQPWLSSLAWLTGWVRDFYSKTLLAGLLRSLGETEELGASLQKVWDAPDSVSAVDEWARHLARAHPRILPIARAVEQVRRSDPDANALRENIMGRWRMGCRRLMTWLDDEGRLASEWTVDSAADMVWALMSWDVLEGLLDDCGWSRDEYAERLALVLRSTFVGRRRQSASAG